jgi:hypothetical protein
MKFIVYFPDDGEFLEAEQAFVSVAGKEEWQSLDSWGSVDVAEVIKGFAEYQGEAYPCIVMQVTDDLTDNTSTLINLRKYRREKNMKVESMLKLIPRVRRCGPGRLSLPPLNVR